MKALQRETQSMEAGILLAKWEKLRNLKIISLNNSFN